MTKSKSEKSVSRRSFLQASSGAVALPFLAGAHAAGSDIVRVGVIGCGSRGAGAARDSMTADKGVRIVALGDLLKSRVMEKRAALQERYPQQMSVSDDHCFSGFGAYKGVIEASDVVIIANAAKFHPLHLLTSIEAGRHVFVEKPHAVDPAGAKTVQEACRLAAEKDLSVVSGLQSRFHPGYQETMQRVHDGAVGRIVAIQETWLRPPYGLYPRSPGMSEVLFQGSNQYHFNWLCGDDVPQTLIHNLDRSSWALHNAAPERAYGMGGRSSLSRNVYGNVFDHHSVVYQFPEGVRVYAFCRTIHNCYNENSSLILGTKGRCDLLKLKIEGETNWQHPGVGENGNPYVLEHVALIQAVRSGQPINNADYMVQSTLIAMMGQFSCYTGQELEWSQFNESNFFFPPRPEDCHEEMDPPVRPGPDGTYPVMVPGETRLI